MESFKDQGFSISHNPSGNGNCQFSTLSYLLKNIGIHGSARTFRQEVVNYLSENTENSKGQPLEHFARLPWSQYLNSMTQTGTYGDHITLQAASNLYNIWFQIVFSFGNNAQTLIQLQEFEPLIQMQEFISIC